MRSAPAARAPCRRASPSAAAPAPARGRARSAPCAAADTAPPRAARGRPHRAGDPRQVGRIALRGGARRRRNSRCPRRAPGLPRQARAQAAPPKTISTQAAHPRAAPGSAAQRLNERRRGARLESRRQHAAEPGARGVAVQAVHRILLPHASAAARRSAPANGRGAPCRRRAPSPPGFSKAVLRAGVPEAEQVIGHRLRQVTAFAVFAHAGGAVALGQGRAIGAHDQRDVPVERVPGGPRAARISSWRGVLAR